MGKLATIRDFLVDTNGHCFICLSRTSQPRFNSDGLGVEPAATYSSVHALSQYLKMDMSKVFHDRETIPPDLLDNVRRSKLKVTSLCEQCSKWNKKIARLYRHLEKIQTEANFYLELIQGSLLRSEDANIDSMSTKLGASSNLDAGLLEKARIVKALRTEAKERCSLKIKTDQARVQVQNLTANQVSSKQKMIKRKRLTKHPISSNQEDEDVSKSTMNLFSDGDHIIKTEGSDRNEYFDYDGDHRDHEFMEDISKCDNDNPSPRSEDRQPNLVSATAPSVEVLIPAGSRKKMEKLTYAKNPETGKFKCNICSAEFNQKRYLKRHYERIHLNIKNINIKHKCNLCGKEFAQKAHYNRHHRTVHVGVRFKCNFCGKCFTRNQNLILHQQSEHFAK